MNRITKLLVICCAVVIVSGCETRSRNAHPKSKQNSSEKKTKHINKTKQKNSSSIDTNIKKMMVNITRIVRRTRRHEELK